jgi:hypothetical protein
VSPAAGARYGYGCLAAIRGAGGHSSLTCREKGSAAPDGAVALHANRCRRAARGRRAVARACACEPWPAKKMFVGVQDGKDEENPTKDRDTSAFTRPGIALANDSAIGNSLPSLKGQTSERSSFGKHRLHLNLRALMVLMPFLENPSYVAECRCMEEA